MTQPTPSEPSETSAAPAAARTAHEGEMSEARRDELASKLVDRFSVWSGAAGLIPVPIVDVASIAGVQLQMLRRLSALYGVPFSDNLGKSVIASLAGSIIPASSTIGIASALKAVPAIGMAVSGVVMPLAGAGATWVIGKVFIQHFTSGGTLLDFNPPDYREFIKAQREKWWIRSTEPASAELAAPGPAASSPVTDAVKGAPADA